MSTATITRPCLVTSRPPLVNASPCSTGSSVTPSAPNRKPVIAMISSAVPAVATTRVTLGWLNSGRMTRRSVSSATPIAIVTPKMAAIG